MTTTQLRRPAAAPPRAQDRQTAEIVGLREAGLSWRRIADQVGINAGTARSRYHAAESNPSVSRSEWRCGLDREWAARWAEVRSHFATYGEWPRLPSRADPGARVLGRWIARQRKLHRRGLLRADRQRQMRAAGLVLDPQLGRPPTRARARRGVG